MKKSKVLNTYLIISGILLAFIGGATLIMPVNMKADAGIHIANNISVINDVRATAALLLGAGIITLLGSFSKKLTYSSTLIAVLIFLGLGTGRLLSIITDGMPVDGLVKATGLEFILGIIGLILFQVFKEKNQ